MGITTIKGKGARVGSRGHGAKQTLQEPSEDLERVVEQRTSELAAALDKLQKREGMFRALTENTTDSTLVIGTNGLITYASPAVEENSGYAIEEVIGQKYESFAVEEDIDAVRAAFQRALASPGQTFYVPKSRARLKDGRTIYYEALVTDMTQVEGVDGIVVHMRDI